MTTARNERCPCGSGKKYKRCHGDAAATQKDRGKLAMILVGAALVLGLGALAYEFVGQGNTEGRVWSQEHGHWHGPDGREIGASGVASPGSGGGFTPQPPGEVPAGKVWSTEHGHWHDQ